MKTSFNILIALLSVLAISSCATPKKSIKEQTIVFKDSEVPYFKKVVKNGQITVEIVEPSPL